MLARLLRLYVVSFVGLCFFSVPSQEIGWEECLPHDLFCVEWDVKPCCVPFSIGNGQPGEPALCQLYRHTLVPYLRSFHTTVPWDIATIELARSRPRRWLLPAIAV